MVGRAERRERVLEVVEREPVGEVPVLEPEALAAVVRVVARLDVVHPHLHRGVHLAQERPVAGVDVGGPRDDRRGVAPCGGAVAAAVDPPLHGLGDGEGHAAEVVLLQPDHVPDELVEERRAVVVEARGAAEGLDVARPAEALVALRAVGRHVEEVAALAPDGVEEEAVQLLVSGLDVSGARQVRVDHEPAEVLRIGVRDALEADVAEAEEREMRAHGLADLAGGGVDELCAGAAEVVAEEVAVGVEDLARLEAPRRAGRRAVHDLDPAGHLLAEVEDDLALRRADDVGLFQNLRHADRRREAVGERTYAARAVVEGGLPRVAARELPHDRGGRPLRGRRRDARVEVLAVVDLALRDGRGGGLPRGVGLREELRARAHLADRGGLVAVGRDVLLPAGHLRAVPALADVELDFVLPGLQQRPEVERHRLHVVEVVVVAGQEHLVRGAPAVHEDLEDAERGDVGARRGGGVALRQRERAAQAEVARRAALALRQIAGDPLRLPRLGHLARLEPRVRGRRLAVVGEDVDAPEVARAGREVERGGVGERIERRLAAVVQELPEPGVRGDADARPDGLRGLVGLGDPGEREVREVAPERAVEVVGAEVGDLHGGGVMSTVRSVGGRA